MRMFAAHSGTSKLINLAGTEISWEEEWETIHSTESLQPTAWHYGAEATWSWIYIFLF